MIESSVIQVAHQEIKNHLVTIQELAEYLRVHPCTIRIWVKEGLIKAYGNGRILRFDRGEVLRSLERNATNEPASLTGNRSLKTRLRQKHQP